MIPTILPASSIRGPRQRAGKPPAGRSPHLATALGSLGVFDFDAAAQASALAGGERELSPVWTELVESGLVALSVENQWIQLATLRTDEVDTAQPRGIDEEYTPPVHVLEPQRGVAGLEDEAVVASAPQARDVGLGEAHLGAPAAEVAVVPAAG